MIKNIKYLSLVALSLSLVSHCYADFDKNEELVETLKNNHIRLVVLSNFQGSNNLLDIVTASASPGYELTNLGLAQLQDTVPALLPYSISKIYAATAFRTLQTTNLLGKALQLQPDQMIPDKRLDMQNFGSADGEDYDVYKLRFTSQKDMFENTPENGESGVSVFTRTEDFLSGLTTYNDQTILIVTNAFNYCHISKCLTGKYGNLPKTGTFTVYDFSKLD